MKQHSYFHANIIVQSFRRAAVPTSIPLFFLLFCCLLTPPDTFGQRMSVAAVQTDSFPVIRSKITVLQADGSPLNPLNASDIRITENGVERRVLSVVCPPTAQPSPISVVLAVDISGSMRFYGNSQVGSGDRNYDVAKKAASAFLDALAAPPSECAITTFNTYSYVNQDFTQDKQALKATLDNLGNVLGGGTSYSAGFLGPISGALPVAARGQYKRVVIFLTDGYQSRGSVDENAVVAAAQASGTIVFSIALRLPIPDVIKNIAERTGGEGFSNIQTAEEAEDVYRRILNRVQGYAPCDIAWETDSSCSTQREALIELPALGLSQQISYSVPDSILPGADIAPLGTPFGTVAVGQFLDRTVDVTASGSGVRIDALVLSDPRFSVQSVAPPLPAALADGESISVVVRYTPTDLLYAYAEMSVLGSVCNTPVAYFSGGSSDNPPNVPTLRIIVPNGGEAYTGQADTLIEWRGVLPQDTVTLEYSIDAGATWNLITDKGTGLRHAWRVPSTPSKRCLMRASQQTGIKSFAVIPFSTAAKDVVFSPDGSALYILTRDGVYHRFSSAGTLNYSVNAANAAHIAVNANGSWIAVSRNDGQGRVYDAVSGTQAATMPITPILGKMSFVGTNILAAPVNNSGWVGTVVPPTQFNFSVTLNGHTARIAEFSASSDFRRLLSSGSTDNSARIWDWQSGAAAVRTFNHPFALRDVALAPDGLSALTVDNAGTLRIWDVANNSAQILSDGVASADYKRDGSLAVVGKSIAEAGVVYGEIYRMNGARTARLGGANAHTDTILAVAWQPNGDIIATAGADNSVRLWRTATGQVDVSDSLWNIVAPDIALTAVDMGIVEVGDSRDSVVMGYIVNRGDIPARLTSIAVTGGDIGDFAVVNSFVPGQYLNPGDSIPVEWSFLPSAAGLRSATVSLSADAAIITAPITGVGVIIGLESLPIINFGKVFLGDRKDTVVAAVLRNTGTVPLVFSTPLLGLPDNIQFQFASQQAAFTLAPADSLAIRLQFSPTRLGLTSGQIVLDGESPVSTQKIVRLVGEGVCAGGPLTIAASAAAAALNPGDTLRVPIVLQQHPANKVQSYFRPFSMTLSYNSDVLHLAESAPEGLAVHGKNSIVVSGTSSTEVDTALHLTFIVTLGTEDSARVRVESFQWDDCNSGPAPLSLSIPINICRTGGNRLYDANGQGLSLAIYPNPISKDAAVEITAAEQGRTILTLATLLGEPLYRLFDGDIAAGTFKETADFSNLAEGAYLAILETPTARKTLMVFISR